ncbi:MAG: phosphotransferase [Kiritimatiellaeota bacterium]|nr:phosphotransferase [Kiritimatiellota bacterium]
MRENVPEVRGSLEFRRVPTGKFNTSWFVRDGTGRELVLRIAPPDDTEFVFYERDMMRQEPELHCLLREKTSVPVPRILAYDDSRRFVDRDFLIMERLPGRPLTELRGVDVDGVYRQVGRYLAEVHALAAPNYGYLGAHRPMPPCDRWAEAFKVMWGKLVADITRVGLYDTAEEAAMRDLLERHVSVFDRPVPAALLHMDVWNQNILVEGSGRVVGLIDWDRALWGDPEIEFAVLDYCGVSVPAFWEGYGRRRDISPEARVRHAFYLLYEMQKYIVIRQGRNHDPRAASVAKAQVRNVVRQAFGP